MPGYRRASGWPARFDGLIAAAATPMREDLSIDLERVGPYVDFLLACGAAGLMAGGTTGEFVAMEVEERASVISAFVAAADGRVPVIAHVGHADGRLARHLAEHATREGADALAAVTPYFHRSTPAAVEAYARDLARSAPELPFFAYSYPGAAANAWPPHAFEPLLSEPNVHGIKLSVDSWEEIEPFMRFGPEILVVCGNDGLMERFAAAGGRAIVSGNAAALPDVVAAVFDAFRRGEATDAGRAAVGALVQLTRAGAVDQLKRLLRLRGMDVGPARVRTHVPSEVDGRRLPDALDALLGPYER